MKACVFEMLSPDFNEIFRKYHYRPRNSLFSFGYVPASRGIFTFDHLKITWVVYLHIL